MLDPDAGHNENGEDMLFRLHEIQDDADGMCVGGYDKSEVSCPTGRWVREAYRLHAARLRILEREGRKTRTQRAAA